MFLVAPAGVAQQTMISRVPSPIACPGFFSDSPQLAPVTTYTLHVQRLGISTHVFRPLSAACERRECPETICYSVR